jgi:hypothetical protein
MLSSRFRYSGTLVSIKLHFQVRLSVQSAFQHCAWNSEISLALSTDCHCGHGADPLDYTQSALIGRHLRNIPAISNGTPYSVFFIQADRGEEFVAEMSIRHFEDVAGRAGAKVRSLNFHMVNRRRVSYVGLE